MTRTKSKTIQTVSEANGFSRKKASKTVGSVMELIKSSLESEDYVLISGFGKFQVNEKTERRGRNFATGTEMMLAPRKVLTLKCSRELRERITRANPVLIIEEI